MADATRVVASVRADPAGSLVALDFDGTLAPIVARPELARPASGAVPVLQSLTRSLGCVAIVTGRPALEVVRLGGLEAVAGLTVLGHYGLQSWRAGALDSPPPEPAVAAVRAALPELLGHAPDGVFVEDKVHSLVVHTRPAASPQATLDDLMPALRELAGEHGLDVVPGRFVAELRPAGVDKGTVLTTLVHECGARVVVYAGDDLGDLPAYSAVERLRAEGRVVGLTIASSDVAGDAVAPQELLERADLVLAGPSAVVSWLAALAV